MIVDINGSQPPVKLLFKYIYIYIYLDILNYKAGI